MPEQAASQQWYYMIADQRFGPYDTAEMLDRAREGFFHWDVLVWHEGMSKWQPISAMPEFAGAPLGDPPKVKSNGASDAFIYGILSLLPVLGLFALVPSYVFSFTALRICRTEPRRNRNRWMAIVGLVLSIVSTVYHLLVLVAILVR